MSRGVQTGRLWFFYGLALIASVLAVVVWSTRETPTLESAPADTGRGAELYSSMCASCHGGDLRGTDLGPSHLSILYEPNHHTDDSFRSAITNGARQHHWSFGDMVPVVGLDDDDIDAIIAYVRQQQQIQGFEG
ncbi:MAG: c-type cytochrome [Actinobacteria bacterium]|nr:c-type cytochrome [Actinomycetota bacterium]